MAADDGFRGKKQVGLRLRRGVGVGDRQRARGSHRVQSKGYSEEGGKRTGQGRGERGTGVKFGRGVSEKKGGCVLGREIADNCRGGERRS
jgi:hypothetical protein